jgi:hypothetical protein
MADAAIIGCRAFDTPFSLADYYYCLVPPRHCFQLFDAIFATPLPALICRHARLTLRHAEIFVLAADWLTLLPPFFA